MVSSISGKLQAFLAGWNVCKWDLLSQARLAIIGAMNSEPIQAAVEKAGGVNALASAVGVSYQAVQQWVKARRVPAERVLDIERATGVTRHSLRPDLYPE